MAYICHVEMTDMNIANELFTKYPDLYLLSYRVVELIRKVRKWEDKETEEEILSLDPFERRTITLDSFDLGCASLRYYFPSLYGEASQIIGDIAIIQIPTPENIIDTILDNIGDDTQYYVRKGDKIELVTVAYNLDLGEIVANILRSLITITGDNDGEMAFNIAYYLQEELEHMLGFSDKPDYKLLCMTPMDIEERNNRLMSMLE